MNSEHASNERINSASSTKQPTDKQRWEAPAVTTFKPVTETQGISYRIGDGISNLSV